MNPKLSPDETTVSRPENHERAHSARHEAAKEEANKRTRNDSCATTYDWDAREEQEQYSPLPVSWGDPRLNSTEGAPYRGGTTLLRSEAFVPSPPLNLSSKRKYSESTGSRYPDALGDDELARKRPARRESSAVDLEASEPLDHSAHREFASALFEIGLSHASPSVLLENMNIRDHRITSERVKSHLQKYRKNKQKSRQEFLTQYDRFLHFSTTTTPTGERAVTDYPSLATVLLTEYNRSEAGGLELPFYLDYPLLGGYAAAFVTTSVTLPTQRTSSATPSSAEWTEQLAHSQQEVAFPVLTPQEAASPLGQSLQQAFSVVQPLCRYIVQQRLRMGQHLRTGAADEEHDSCSEGYGEALSEYDSLT